VVQITITHLSGARRNAVETFATLPLKLGRAGGCDVRFDPDQDVKVSAEHAELRSDGQGGLSIADLQSTNGVLVNGVRVDGSAPVPNHAVIEVGADGPRLKLTFERGAHGISFSKLRRPDAAAPGSAVERNLRTTDETPAYTEADVEAWQATKTDARGLSPALIVGAVVVVVVVGAIVAAIAL
jgi:predicted component of type VI protein secretion system